MRTHVTVLGLMGEQGQDGEREGKEAARCRNPWRINAGKGRLIIITIFKSKL